MNRSKGYNNRIKYTMSINNISMCHTITAELADNCYNVLSMTKLSHTLKPLWDSKHLTVKAEHSSRQITLKSYYFHLSLKENSDIFPFITVSVDHKPYICLEWPLITLYIHCGPLYTKWPRHNTYITLSPIVKWHTNILRLA